MKYFIFGGNGFVGRYLANALLERNEKVVVCDLHPTLDERVTKGCEYRQTDIRDKQQLSTIPFLRMTLLSILLLINTIPRCPVIEETTSLA